MTVNVGTVPVDPGAMRVGLFGDERAPALLIFTVPAEVFAAICPKLSLVAVPFTTFEMEIGATTVASAPVFTDAVGPAPNAALEAKRPSTAAETRSLFMTYSLFDSRAADGIPLDTVIARTVATRSRGSRS